MRRAASLCFLVTTALLGVPSCKLTESIRTRPAPPGPATSPTIQPGRDGSPPSAADGGLDAKSPVLADGESPDRSDPPAQDGGGGGGSSGDSGGGGSSGMAGDASSAGGSLTGTGGRMYSFDAAGCSPAPASQACDSYCLSLSVGVGCGLDYQVPDSGGDEMALDECTCRCEAQYRYACRDEFDELIACGGVPLMLMCNEGDDFPIVAGACGALRYAFQECIREANKPPLDASID